LTIGVLLPFIGKPFNMDDPLFIWSAQQIHTHPFNPYGFNMEWDWRQAPMYKVTENPPLTSYYLALAAGVLGWSEAALHVAFLLPVLSVILGTCRLARLFCNSPVLAALVTLFTPAFLVSSTTLMSDVPMVAFWVWTLIFWIEGTDQNDWFKLLVAGCLAGLAEITKYYAIGLLPLLAAYSITSRRSLRGWGQFLLIPLAVFCAYQSAMVHLYGLYPLLRASDFISAKENILSVLGPDFLVGLAFTGGCLAPALFFIPMLGKRWSIVFLAAGILIVGVIFFDPGLLRAYSSVQAGSRVAVEIQLALWAATGMTVLALAGAEIKTGMNAKSLLLVLWLFGTFIFAVFVNWTINARSLLPLAPVLGILIARRLEQNSSGSVCLRRMAVCTVTGALLALYITIADCLTALAVRQNVRSIYSELGQNIRLVHFQGHWGFQFYMTQFGAAPLDFKNDILKPGDLVAIPSNNTNLLPLAPGNATLLKVYSGSVPSIVATISQPLGAGFYASILGPLPFAFGPVPQERVGIYSLQ
jgi:4-amino-4-deoxy-L-arabinose transferase-like glycosyltransferase